MPFARIVWLLLLAVPVAPLAAQGPRTAAEALARFEKVKDGSEAERRRAVGDLGDFADAEVTDVLLAELARAADLGYRQVVVRAIGERQRPAPGVVPALENALRDADNARLMDSVAEGLARQGEPGVTALGALLAEQRDGALRTSICNGLGRAEGDAARDLLVKECKTAGGRSRLPALDALRRRSNDPVVDELRVLLARDGDAVIAASAVGQLAEHGHGEAPALALELARRLNDRSTPDQYAAVLRGLLQRLATDHFEPILVAATRGRDPFGKALLEPWQKALADEPFLRWLVSAAPARKLAAECSTAATALGLVPVPGREVATPALVRLLNHREPDVVRSAARALAGYGPELSLQPLQKLLANAPEALQPAAAQALHDQRAGDASWHGELVAHSKGKSPTLRAAALQLLARCEGLDAGPALQAAGENLDHKAWQVRAAAIDLIVALRLPAGIPWLIERIDVEQARLHEDVVQALYDLTRLRLPNATAWRAWWQKEGPGFKVPAAAGDERKEKKGPGATAATYWDIPVRSDRVVFVVDVSGSMTQPFGTGGGTRLDEAKRQLVRVLGMLPGKAKLNVVTFGTTAATFRDTLQALDEKLRLSAEIHAKGLVARGSTNVHDGLQRAFADPEVDTIFLLTDGAPSSGPIVDADALAKQVASWNLGRGVRIHTVALGGKSPFLERLARESGGEHTVAR